MPFPLDFFKLSNQRHENAKVDKESRNNASVRVSCSFFFKYLFSQKFIMYVCTNGDTVVLTIYPADEYDLPYSSHIPL